MKRINIAAILILLNVSVFAQMPIRETWSANWISHPTADKLNYGVFHFRKNITLTQKPQHFVVHISADNKYKLYVNGQYVVAGPAIGDQDNWFYETIDLAPYLKQGKNTIAALVWNFGTQRGWNQISVKTAFLLQGNSHEEEIANSDNTWKVLRNAGYFPKENSPKETIYGFVIGCTDSVHVAHYPKDWTKEDFADETWQNATVIERPLSKGKGSGTYWSLTPRPIPLLSQQIQRLSKIRKTNLTIASETAFLQGNAPITVPPFFKGTILLDQQHLVNAYTVLKLERGKDATVVLTYAESLFDEKNRKGNRNEIEGKTIKGKKDVFVLDGKTHTLQPLEYRTYRYLQIDISTQQEPLVIADIYGDAVGYPLEENAVFKCDDTTLHQIWQVGWRTARLCAMDTYIDCPYYERMQYIGDTRIQALISLYVSGDTRLMKHAIQLLNSSRNGEGITQSRYPTQVPQYIPPFSLFWVSMLYDYYMHTPDSNFIREHLTGVQAILDWYAQKVNPNSQFVGAVPYWNFVDWTSKWYWDNKKQIGGVPSGVEEGKSAIISLQYVYTLQQAVVMLRHFQMKEKANDYEKLAQNIKKAVYKECWDTQKQLLADTPDKISFSQHANIWALLTGTIPEKEQKNVMKKLISDATLIQASYYFKFYFMQALKQVGMGNEYTSQLTPWKNALALGFTTFPEMPEPTRSDCHAWSASPNYDFLATIAGITPSAPHFKQVKIAPQLGNLTEIDATMPHYWGNIHVKIKKQKEQYWAEITLPKGLTGYFEWKDKKYSLKSVQTNKFVVSN